MGELADSENWATATVVTSRIHVRRVSTLFQQCTNLEVAVVYADYLDRKQVMRQLFHEVGGYIKFWLTKPC